MSARSYPPNSNDVAKRILEGSEVERSSRVRLERSPHPYLRHKNELDNAETTPDPLRDTRVVLKGNVLSNRAGKYKHESRPMSRSDGLITSESGTDVDEESIRLARALPPPAFKPSKGLKQLVADGVDQSPLLTPSQLDDEPLGLDLEYFTLEKKKIATAPPPEEAIKAYEKFVRRRRAEFLRRSCEVASLAAVGLCVLLTPGAADCAIVSYRPLISQLLVVISLLLLYILRVLSGPLLQNFEFRFGKIRVPSSFDPATVIYPTALPVLIALSISSLSNAVLLPNIILGLCVLPARLFPNSGAEAAFNSLHWAVSIVPLLATENTAWSSKWLPSTPYHLLSIKGKQLDPEDLVLLFPLQQSLLTILQYLTTTSLLTSELQLLSVCLIDLLLLSESPQSRILSSILWIGGLCLLILCDWALTANVTLERIPSWRFKRAANVARAGIAFSSLLRRHHKHGETHEVVSDEDADARLSMNGRPNSLRPNLYFSRRSDHMVTPATRSPPTSVPVVPDSAARRRRSIPASARTLLALSSAEVVKRKWMYSGYAIITTILIVLLPVRYAVENFALDGYEPFGWAIGYLFSDFPTVLSVSAELKLQNWIVKPSPMDLAMGGIHASRGWIERLRIDYFGEANTRLILFAYWAGVIAVGILTVLLLSSSVEVDTRRKVFHGMMVVMLLPTTFIDPAFLSLGLALVLSVFLLLDLFRAAQLRPISRPIAKFLMPYIDGRDLRGPVVISHIFLLIGCAIPLWLSLAGVSRIGVGPWKGWEVKHRDLSMVAGVICVGMGDAAASLVGRRYGRHKWPWTGGKSLEGSAAFAIAVSAGLLAGRSWLRCGGWSTARGDGESWAATIAKTAVAACGASFTEAVLTGCNDNVVVPVILWLLVRGTQL